MSLPGIKKGNIQKLTTVSARMTAAHRKLLQRYSDFMQRPVGELAGELIAFAISRDAEFAEVEKAHGAASSGVPSDSTAIRSSKKNAAGA